MSACPDSRGTVPGGSGAEKPFVNDILLGIQENAGNTEGPPVGLGCGLEAGHVPVAWTACVNMHALPYCACQHAPAAHFHDVWGSLNSLDHISMLVASSIGCVSGCPGHSLAKSTASACRAWSPPASNAFTSSGAPAAPKVQTRFSRSCGHEIQRIDQTTLIAACSTNGVHTLQSLPGTRLGQVRWTLGRPLQRRSQGAKN